MKSIFKRTSILFFATLIVFSSVFSGCLTRNNVSPFTLKAEASAKHKSGYYTYTIENSEATIVDCDTSIRGNKTIPSKLDGYPVTGIGDSAFSCCDNLKDIKIPDSVTYIGEDAFRYEWYYDEMDEWKDGVLYIGNYLIDANKEFVEGDYEVKSGTIAIADDAFGFCEYLTSVKLPSGLKTIGNYSFTNCSNLTNINMPNSVNYLGDCAFFNCDSLESITISSSITTIPSLAFDSCRNLKSVTIPLSVTRIDYCAFNMCLSLSDIYYEGSEADWQNISIDRNYCEDLTYATNHFNSPMPEGEGISFSSSEGSSSWLWVVLGIVVVGLFGIAIVAAVTVIAIIIKKKK